MPGKKESNLDSTMDQKLGIGGQTEKEENADINVAGNLAWNIAVLWKRSQTRQVLFDWSFCFLQNNVSKTASSI